MSIRPIKGENKSEKTLYLQTLDYMSKPENSNYEHKISSFRKV